MCEVPTQEFSNGFCYDICPGGYKGYNGMCLQNCPSSYVDHGLSCEAPSVLRKPAKSYLMPCVETQIERNGDCFEPQSVNYTMIPGPSGVKIPVPRITGCGCIRRKFIDRVQCPSGYSIYNGGCVSDCPSGFQSILDSNGNIDSMYCQQYCPYETNSKTRWQLLGGLCMKSWLKRIPVRQTSTNLSTVTNTTSRGLQLQLGLPSTSLSYLASRPLGSSLNERVRSGQSIPASLLINGYGPAGIGSSAVSSILGDSWMALLLDPSKLLLALFLFGLLIFGGPTLFKLISNGLGSLISGVGSAGGSIAKGVGSAAGKIAESTGELVGSTQNLVSSAEKAAGNRIESKSLQNLAASRDALAIADANASAAEINFDGIRARTADSVNNYN